jgi:hypothetical protein
MPDIACNTPPQKRDGGLTGVVSQLLLRGTL